MCFLYSLCLHYCLINIHIFSYLDSRLSRLFTQVPTSPDNRGSTILFRSSVSEYFFCLTLHICTICIKGVGQTWVRHCPITNKYWCQGCALRKIEGSPVLWTCEILGAQHIISIEKVTFSSCPGANLVAKGYWTLLVLTALYLLQIWLMLILLLLADLCAKDKEFPL